MELKNIPNFNAFVYLSNLWNFLTWTVLDLGVVSVLFCGVTGISTGISTSSLKTWAGANVYLVDSWIAGEEQV